MSRSRASHVACIVVVLSAAACSSREPATAPTVSEATFGNGGDVRIRFTSSAASGDLVVDPGLAAEFKSTTVGGAASPGSGFRVRGRLVEFTGGELRIGDRSYGPLKGAVHIELRPDEVLVNGESRGPLEP
jgi:hypothetical protein